MPLNGGDTTSTMSSGDKLASLSLATAGAVDTPDFGEAFQPHVDTKQIHVQPETSPGEILIYPLINGRFDGNQREIYGEIVYLV